MAALPYLLPLLLEWRACSRTHCNRTDKDSNHKPKQGLEPKTDYLQYALLFYLKRLYVEDTF